MKHVKTFENSHNLNNFIIWATPLTDPSFYHIVKVLDQYEHKAVIQILYVYDIENDKLTQENTKPYFKEYEQVTKSIVHRDNSLDSCLNILPLLKNKSNYNI